MHYGRDGQVLTHPAHEPDAARPLRIGNSEVYSNPKPTTGNGTSQNDNGVLRQDLYHLITNTLPKLHTVPLTKIRTRCQHKPFPQDRDPAKLHSCTGASQTAGYIANPSPLQVKGTLMWVSQVLQLRPCRCIVLQIKSCEKRTRPMLANSS